MPHIHIVYTCGQNGENRAQSFWDFLSDFDVQQRVKQWTIVYTHNMTNEIHHDETYFKLHMIGRLIGKYEWASELMLALLARRQAHWQVRVGKCTHAL